MNIAQPACRLTLPRLACLLPALALSAFAGPVGGSAKMPAPVPPPAPEPPACVGPQRPCQCNGAYAGNTEPFSVNLTAGYESTFFCRGMDMGDDLYNATVTVDAQIVPNLTWTGSFRYLNVDDSGFEEGHLYTGLFYTIGPVSFGPSFKWYHNWEGGMLEDAYDVGIQGLVHAGPVDIYAGAYYETESEGYYYELGISSEIPLCSHVCLVPSAEISYTDGWMMPGAQDWNEFILRLAVPIHITHDLKLVPFIAGHFPLAALDGMQDDKLAGGVSISYTF